MTALSDALTAAQRSALAALEKAYVASTSRFIGERRASCRKAWQRHRPVSRWEPVERWKRSRLCCHPVYR